MVQRSPTCIGAKPNSTPLSSWVRKILPLSWVAAWDCFYHVVTCYLLVVFCSKYPQTAKSVLLKGVSDALPKDIQMHPHFKPRSMPWEQRLCLAPDGDSLAAPHRRNTHVVTGEIETVTAHGIRMLDGTCIDANVIVTATRMRMKLGGDIDLRLDGDPVSWAKRAVWNGAMLDNVPSLVFMLGHTNASWTLGADDWSPRGFWWGFWSISSRSRPRLWPHMPLETRSRRSSVHGRLDAPTAERWTASCLHMYGIKGPWRPSRLNPIADYVHARWGNVTEDLGWFSRR